MNKRSAPSIEPARLDDLCLNTIRFLSVDAVEKANSGNPGLPMGAAPMAYDFWTRFLRHNPANPHWFNRDRYVLSAKHGSMLLYRLLHLTGYERKISVRLVSMPSWELFDAQPSSYRDSVQPPLTRARLAVEAGATQGWSKYVGDQGGVIGVDRFGASAPGEVMRLEFGFTGDNVYKHAMLLIDQKPASKRTKNQQHENKRPT